MKWKMEKATLGFRIYKIWQILKRFTRQLIWAHIPNFWRVSNYLKAARSLFFKWCSGLSSKSFTVLLTRDNFEPLFPPTIFFADFGIAVVVLALLVMSCALSTTEENFKDFLGVSTDVFSVASTGLEAIGRTFFGSGLISNLGFRILADLLGSAGCTLT